MAQVEIERLERSREAAAIRERATVITASFIALIIAAITGIVIWHGL